MGAPRCSLMPCFSTRLQGATGETPYLFRPDIHLKWCPHWSHAGAGHLHSSQVSKSETGYFELFAKLLGRLWEYGAKPRACQTFHSALAKSGRDYGGAWVCARRVFCFPPLKRARWNCSIDHRINFVLGLLIQYGKL